MQPRDPRREADRLADEWVARIDPQGKVGSKHHIVPQFLLDRFARNGQVWVRDRERDLAPGSGSLRSPKDLAFRDFYTITTTSGTPDGRLEDALALTEERAAPIVERLLSPFHPPAPLTEQETADLAQFLSFIRVRGARPRREHELRVDWYAKTTAGGRYDSVEFEKIRIVPHQNDYLSMLGFLAETLFPRLVTRPAALVTVDQPGLITGDEPLVYIMDDPEPPHTPDCVLTEEELQRRARRRKAGRRGHRHTVHLWSTRPEGIEGANEVALPLTPTAALLLGPEHASAARHHLPLRGQDAKDFVAMLNQEVVRNSYLWLVGHPGNVEFRNAVLDQPGPILGICDGGTVASRGAVGAPSPRSPERFRKNWV